jgi:hypothetical protein
MNVANSNDSCNSIDSSHGVNDAFAISTERTVFARTSVEAPVVELLTVTKHSNDLYPNRQERAKIATLGRHHAHHRRCVVEKVLQSHSCSSANEGSKTFSSLPVSSSKRRLPLTSIVTRKKLASSSTLRRAVLPKRRRQLSGEKYPKRFCHSVPKHDLVEIMVRRGMAVEIMVRRGMADAKKGGKLAEEFVRRQCLGGHNSSNGCTRTTRSAPVRKEGTQGTHTNNDDIDSTTIFRQLNILKRGGYWKYLPREDAQEEEHHWDEERLPERRSNLFRKEENKENFPRASHPNTRIAYRSQREWEWDNEEDDDDHEDYGEEGETHRNSIDPFVGSALEISNKNYIDIECIGFRVHTVTKDGWMCSSEQICCGNNNCDGATAGSTKQQQQQQQPQQQLLVMLHLPSKVATLGRQGMCVRGMDLMKRRNNGVLEPHTHRHANTGYGNGHGILEDRPSTTMNHYLLFGRISL